MPEAQAPFIYACGCSRLKVEAGLCSYNPRPPFGSVTPRRGAPSIRLLSSLSLERQIRAVTGAAAYEDAGLDRATDTLQLLREPAINAVVTAMVTLEPADAAILGDAATALLGADRRRPKLILALRAALESVS